MNLEIKEGWPEDLAGRAQGFREEALNLLGFFGSFFCQEKNERKAGLTEKEILKRGVFLMILQKAFF